jgi:hypothetical protein
MLQELILGRAWFAPADSLHAASRDFDPRRRAKDYADAVAALRRKRRG